MFGFGYENLVGTFARIETVKNVMKLLLAKVVD